MLRSRVLSIIERTTIPSSRKYWKLICIIWRFSCETFSCHNSHLSFCRIWKSYVGSYSGWYVLRSSAESLTQLQMLSETSLTYMRNKIGSRTLRCWTSLAIGCGAEQLPPVVTWRPCPHKNPLVHFRKNRRRHTFPSSVAVSHEGPHQKL